MPGRDTAIAIGARRSAHLRSRLAAELTGARLGAGLSKREVGRRIGVSEQRIARIERGHPGTLTIDLLARLGPVLGLQLAAALYPDGDPVRDRAHLALLERFRARLAPTLRWRVEVPIPIAGDRRSGDVAISGNGWDALVEAEVRLEDVQLVERRAAAKQRDLGAGRLILLVADTRHNRSVLRLHPELRERFPIGTRACLKRLATEVDPGNDCLVVL